MTKAGSFSYSAWKSSGGLTRIVPYAAFWMTLIGLGMELGIVGSIQASAQWQSYFGTPTGGTLGLLNGMSQIGMLAACFGSSYIANTLGRRPGAAIGACICIFASALQAGSVNIHMYLAARFFVGFGYVTAHTASVPFLGEFAPEFERTVAVGMYIPFYFIGSIIMSWTCYAVVNYETSWSWRGPSLLQAGPSLIQLVLLLLSPESPRWLALKGRLAEAKAILVKYHGSGQETPMVEDTFKAMVHATEHAPDEGTWMDMINTKASRIRTTIIVVSACFSQLSGNAVISFYIVSILNSVGFTDPKTQTLFNGMLSVWGLIWNVSCAPMSQRFGRRPIFLIGATGMITTFSIFTACTAVYQTSPSKELGGCVLAMIVFFNMAYGMCWSAVAFYPTELWPTRLRAKAQAVNAFWDYGALFIAIYLNPIAVDAIGWRYFTVYIGLLALEIAFVYLFYVETNKHSIEDIADYWEGQMGPLKWFGGPGSYKMMNENARLSAEKRDAAARSEVLEETSSKEEKALASATVVSVPY